MHFFFLTALDDHLAFGSPGWFWALLLLAPLLWVFVDAGRRREALLAKILAPKLQSSLAGQVSPFKRTLRAGCLLLAIALGITALSRPRYGFLDQEIRSRGRDVMLAIDTSRSMLSTDTAPTRLGRAKLIAQDLLEQLRGDRVGLIAFAGTAFLQAPLTLDKGAVLTSINDLDTKTIPKGGTDIASAIRLAIAAFGKGETMSRALVLMTDGEELEENAVEAAKEAAAVGIKIFTIGFGSAEGSLIPIRTENGANDFARDENGNPVNSKLDAPRLTEIAKATGGFYLPYGLDAATVVYTKGILPMEQSDSGTLTARKPVERYAWPASAALLLLALWSVLGEGRRSLLSGALLAALLSLGPSSLRAAPTGGLQDYQQGNYDAALKDFEQRIRSGADAPALRFDAGAAAYKAGDYRKAADYFAGAMTSADPKIRGAATYNLANSLVRSGEAEQEKEAKLSDWNNALQHYGTVLKENPTDPRAKANSAIVRKLIEELKKQQQQEQKQQDKKNDKNQNDRNKENEKKNQSGSGGGGRQDSKDHQSDQRDQQDRNNEQQKSDTSQSGGGEKNQDQHGADQKPSSGNQGNQGSQPPSSGSKGEPSPTPPGQGGSSSGSQPRQQQRPDKTQNPSAPQAGHGVPTPTPAPGNGAESKPEGREGTGDLQSTNAEAAELTPSQARALLRSVEDEEAHQLLNQQNRAVEQPVRDW
jgi:Ca-activated chloride channel homolog